jgi:predicted RND superfamily exporter protein
MPDVLKTMSGGKMPKSQSEILELTSGMEQDGDSSKLQSDSGQNPFEGMVSKDYSLAVISIHISDLPKDKQSELISDINNIIDEAQKPAGLKVGLTGEIVVSSEVTKLIGPTMEQTSGLSLIGILIIVTVLFMSIRYGLTSLMAIAFGVLWVYGLIGFFGISMTSATSGSLSMIMGVGVDFGIQIVNRFRQELKLAKAEKAMKKTLDAVILPMSITTLAALIGFRAMSLGELTLLADLGNIMALGILTCFLAAVTIIPVVLIFSEKIRSRFIK